VRVSPTPTTNVPLRVNYTPTAVTATSLGTSATTLAAGPTTADTNQPIALTATVTHPRRH
jgi:hypothetical protein